MPDESLSRLSRLRYKPQVVAPDRSQIAEFGLKSREQPDIAAVFHENTKTVAEADRLDARAIQRFVSEPAYQYAVASVEPDYPNHETVDLPEPAPELGVDLAEALRVRQTRRRFTGAGLTMQELSTLLKYGCGATGEGDQPGSDIPVDGTVRFTSRTYPSGGGLFPVEPYLLFVNPPDGLEQGLYYYQAERHCLRKLREAGDAVNETLERLFPQDSEKAGRASFGLFLTAAFWRSKAKYGPRGYRFILQESGHLLQNVQLVAEACDLGIVPIGGVCESAADEYIDLDGVDEGLVYAALVGVPGGESGE